MVLAIWVAALFDRSVDYLSSGPFLRVFTGLFVAALVCICVRAVRRTSLADIRPGPVLYAWFLARFVFLPATVLLGLFWLLAWAFGLSFAVTLGDAAQLALMNGMVAILLTSILADLTAAIKGPRPEPPSDS